MKGSGARKAGNFDQSFEPYHGIIWELQPSSVIGNDEGKLGKCAI